MRKLLQSLKRFLFLSILLLFGVGFGFWELIFLSNQTPSKVLGVNTESSIKLLIGGAKEEKNDLKITEKVSGDDARPLIIKKYLEKYDSPLAPYSDFIYQISKDYGYEYYWIVAIAQQESNLCKKIPDDSYNCWGYGIHKKGTLKFESYELSIKSYAEYLKREYFDKGLNTPELIMKKYCPSSNGSWAKGVQQFIDEMENGQI
ncbi:MAG: hypothetical protein WC895_03360 [Candidatus Shapirobacteria bacterium]|jgi:hypothetical protein